MRKCELVLDCPCLDVPIEKERPLFISSEAFEMSGGSLPSVLPVAINSYKMTPKDQTTRRGNDINILLRLLG